jgi:hypothetical protein
MIRHQFYVKKKLVLKVKNKPNFTRGSCEPPAGGSGGSCEPPVTFNFNIDFFGVKMMI